MRRLFTTRSNIDFSGSLGGVNGVELHYVAGTRLATIPGRVPDPLEPRSGCGFVQRCDVALASCAQSSPALLPVAPGHTCRCWRVTA